MDFIKKENISLDFNEHPCCEFVALPHQETLIREAEMPDLPSGYELRIALPHPNNLMY